MPGGLNNPVLGYVAFTTVKFGGYTLAAWRLNQSYPEHARNVAAVGGARTGIGMIAGAALGFLLFPLMLINEFGLLAYYVAFIPVRLVEWWIIILLFYDRHLQTKAKDWRNAGLGTIWSYVLDVPALIGLLATGGLWIC
ncbi:MAG TPA: hypothetical protein VFR78_14440 [Pyrinomonadaceae bacterium]|nr:hypothetical protein [Pyrinomonadaceae bacterium]